MIGPIELAMADLTDFLDISITSPDGVPRLDCDLDSERLEDDAAALAEAIARRRIGLNPRVYGLWESNFTGVSVQSISETDMQLLKAGLLQNIGTPADPAQDQHLNGLVAESVWFEVIKSLDAGLGVPAHRRRIRCIGRTSLRGCRGVAGLRGSSTG